MKELWTKIDLWLDKVPMYFTWFGIIVFFILAMAWPRRERKMHNYRRGFDG